eukprot:9061937-Pyramimonas_sp.AAC.1
MLNFLDPDTTAGHSATLDVDDPEEDATLIRAICMFPEEQTIDAAIFVAVTRKEKKCGAVFRTELPVT